MAHGLETMGRLNDEASVQKPQVALVSTVDSLEAGFPSHCVMLFDSEQAAIQYAVKCIEQYDSDVQYDPETQIWTFDGDFYHNAHDLLDAWQDYLDLTEFFHIKPVQKVE